MSSRMLWQDRWRKQAAAEEATGPLQGSNHQESAGHDIAMHSAPAAQLHEDLKISVAVMMINLSSCNDKVMNLVLGSQDSIFHLVKCFHLCSC